MTNRNSNELIALPILFLAFVLVLGVAIPSDALARVEYTNGSGWTEGDPGDGLEAVGGGSGSQPGDSGIVGDPNKPVNSPEEFFFSFGQGAYESNIFILIDFDGVVHFVRFAQSIDVGWGAK